MCKAPRVDEDVSRGECGLRVVGAVCIGYADDLYSPSRARGSGGLAPTIDSLSEKEGRVGLEVVPGGRRCKTWCKRPSRDSK